MVLQTIPWELSLLIFLEQLSPGGVEGFLDPAFSDEGIPVIIMVDNGGYIGPGRNKGSQKHLLQRF